jgi:hypothetical protein
MRENKGTIRNFYKAILTLQSVKIDCATLGEFKISHHKFYCLKVKFILG